MKKAIIIPILLLFTVLVTSCSKDKDEADNTDKSAAVSQTYQGQLKLGNGSDVLLTYNDVKVKIVRKGANEISLEPVSGQEYAAFTPINYTKLQYIASSDAYVGSNPSTIMFTFKSDASIDLRAAHSLATTVIMFEGTNVK